MLFLISNSLFPSKFTHKQVYFIKLAGYSEAAVLPDPDIVHKSETLEVEAEVEAEVVLPDDSLADTDLHDHDLIDSVMYIYFGSSERDERGAGRQVPLKEYLTLCGIPLKCQNCVFWEMYVT